MDSKFLNCLKCANILSSFLKLAHWNARGMFFYPYHLLFADLYEKISDQIDSLAELASIRGVMVNAEIFATPPVITSSKVSTLSETTLELLLDYAESLEALLAALDTSESYHRSTIINVEDHLAALDNMQYLLEASL